MSSTPKASPRPAARLVQSDDHAVILVDHQSQMAFATKSIDAVQLRNNVALIAKAAAGFRVATILTTVAEKTFSGPIFEEIRSAFAREEIIDRTTMNAWEDRRITDQVNRFGQRKLIFAGLWTSVCIRRSCALRARTGLRRVRDRGCQRRCVG